MSITVLSKPVQGIQVPFRGTRTTPKSSCPESLSAFGVRYWMCRCPPISYLSLIHISEPTRLRRISYAVFCLKKKKKKHKKTKNTEKKKKKKNQHKKTKKQK